MYVIVVYIPVDFVEPVIEAMASHGAGQIGDYRACAFKQLGEGQFEPTEGADPFIGKVGVLEKVPEYRVEMVCESGLVRTILEAMLAAHPYETPAYHVLLAKTVEDFT